MSEYVSFPELDWQVFGWESEISLPSWKGFQERGGAYGSLSSNLEAGETPALPDVEAGGTPALPDVEAGETPALPGSNQPDGSVVALMVLAAGDEEDGPMPEQEDAFKYLMTHEHAVHMSVLCGIHEHYCAMQSKHGKELMPDIGDLEELIGLSTVHILPVAKDGIAYIGFELGCVWEEEHGLGVMTHRDRVVEVGGADTAFTEWIAEGDGGS